MLRYHPFGLELSRVVVLKLQYISESPLGLIKTQLLGPNLRVSESVSLWRGLRICISNHFPVMSMLLAQGRHTWKTTNSFPLRG